MTSTNMLLADLGLDIDLGLLDVMDDASLFVRRSNTFTLTTGVKTPFRGSIEGVDVEAVALLHDAELTRISTRDHLVAGDKNRLTTIVSGVIRPMRMDIFIVHNGKEVNFAEFLLSLENQRRTARGKEVLSIEAFSRTLSAMGLSIYPNAEYGIESSMPLMWQHFGAKDDTVEQAIAMLRRHGGVDALPAPERRGAIRSAVAIPNGKSGIPVREIEVGRNDRTQTKTYGKIITDDNGRKSPFEGTGFLDFCDSIWNSFRRGLTLRTVVAGLNAQIKELSAQEKPNEDTIRALMEQEASTRRAMTSWVSSWGGGQRRPIDQPDGTIKFGDVYDPNVIPSGRFVVVDSDQEVELDFWRPRGESAPAPSVIVDTTGADVVLEPMAGSAEEPF